MRAAAVCCAVVLSGLVGCSDTEGPPRTVEATLIVDWPLAREPGFVVDTFGVLDLDLANDEPIAGGTIPASGTAEVRFIARCGPRALGYKVWMEGHFEQKGEDAVCWMTDFFSFDDCSNPTITTEPTSLSSDDPWGCQIPAN